MCEPRLLDFRTEPPLPPDVVEFRQNWDAFMQRFLALDLEQQKGILRAHAQKMAAEYPGDLVWRNIAMAGEP